MTRLKWSDDYLTEQLIDRLLVHALLSGLLVHKKTVESEFLSITFGNFSTDIK